MPKKQVSSFSEETEKSRLLQRTPPSYSSPADPAGAAVNYPDEPIDDLSLVNKLLVTFDQVGQSSVGIVGGKGANLGEMTRAGLPVPPGFCITTAAYHLCLSTSVEMSTLFAQLKENIPSDNNEQAVAAASELGPIIRRHIQSLAFPEEVKALVIPAWERLGGAAGRPFAVRSSATAEDLPGASFAGQQDTYLNVIGEAALLNRIRDCWASLFTDRAILYRQKNGFDHDKVSLCVVVQQQILPDTAGIAFSADPIDGRRSVVSIDAGFGLGEALVSGLVNADLYTYHKVQKKILSKKVADKRLAILPVTEGGTKQVQLSEEQRHAQVLSDEQIKILGQMVCRVEAHYKGKPQDIEWCFEKGSLYLVQARPITTLYPIPEGVPPPATDKGLRLFLSFGHVQNMTDTISPCGIDLWRRLVGSVVAKHEPTGYSRLLAAGGGHLWVDPTDGLRIGFMKKVMFTVLPALDPCVGNAAVQVSSRSEFIEGEKTRRVGVFGLIWGMLKFFIGLRILPKVVFNIFLRYRRASAPQDVEKWQQDKLKSYENEVKSQPTLAKKLACAKGHIGKLMGEVLPFVVPFVIAGMASLKLLGKLVGNRVPAGEIDTLVRGVAGNVTTEMDLVLGDVVDFAKTEPAAVTWLKDTSNSRMDQFQTLAAANTAPKFCTAFQRFVDKYGCRGGSEIDIARPRWGDDPAPLFNVMRGFLSSEPGAHRKHFASLSVQSDSAAKRILAATPWILRCLASRFIENVQCYMPIREHPKFFLIRYLLILRCLLLEVGTDLAKRGYLSDAQHVFFLTLPECIKAESDPNPQWVGPLVASRLEEYQVYKKLRLPRGITSEGECLLGTATNLSAPAGALVGIAASAGVVEGTAKVILDPAHGVVDKGEILVAPFTDPGWTPLFLNAAAVVIDVGGLMTHGSVIAREYGIPAVVSVDGATTTIATGDKLRVDGDRGFVEILEKAKQ